MEISLSVLFIIFGAVASYLSGILTSLTQEDLSEIIEKDYNSAKILTDLKGQFERDISPFQIYEILFYVSAGVISGHWLSGVYLGVLSELYLILIISAFILLLRYSAQAYGIRNTAKAAPKLKRILKFSNMVVSPFLWIFNQITNKIVGYDYEEASREDITQMVEEAHEEGTIDAGEYRILKNLMYLENIKVSDVMTPRTVVFSLEADILIGEAVKQQDIQMYSRFPVWQGESIDDDILGYVMTRDILHASLEGRNHLRLRDFAREISFIEEYVELDNALEMFLNKKQHQFIVVDQYGGVVGLLTMEDVLEAMLGVEIVDEADKFVDLRLLAKQRREDSFSGKK